MPEFASIIRLSALNGANGFEIRGETAQDFSGGSVSSAGDVNGDGLADLLIGSSAPLLSSSNTSHVVFGRTSRFAANLNLSNLNGATGFEIRGEAAHNSFGFAVSNAGDFNGDGIDDLIVGAPDAGQNFNLSGTSYVVFGKASGFSANLNVSALNGSNGFKIRGEASFNQSGSSVSDAGDVNGDGFADIIIGARTTSPSGLASAAYVVFGKAGGIGAALDLSTLNGATGFQITCNMQNDYSGLAVSGAGDFNGDGFADLVVGADAADPHGSMSGASYVVFGRAAGFAANLNVSALNRNTGFEIRGEAEGDNSGRSVSSAGDLNGDGFADVIIGAYGADASGTRSGASYVVFGRPAGFSAGIDLSTLIGLTGFKIGGEAAFDFCGVSVSGAGDVNGDGLDDLIVGAPRADRSGHYGGASYVVFGKATSFSAILDLTTLNGNNGFKIVGEANGDYSGHSVSSAGDLNGDGFADLIIGSRGADPNGSQSGASHVVFGHRALISVTRLGTAIDQTVNGGTGNDRIWGGGGSDKLIGWEGNDGYLLNDINGSGAHRTFDTVVEMPGGGNDTLIVVSLDNNRTGSDGYALPDNVENAAIRGARRFFLDGNDLENRMSGSDVDNVLRGFDGDDRLNGLDGDDILVGGLGQDDLGGGVGRDELDFNALAETGRTVTTRDRIGGFTHLEDRINLATIDAVAGGANNAFTFRSVHPFTGAGQVRLVQVGDDTIVQINTVGNGVAEATIQLNGVIASTLSAVDFVL